jgi:hypothetical protein
MDFLVYRYRVSVTERFNFRACKVIEIGLELCPKHIHKMSNIIIESIAVIGKMNNPQLILSKDPSRHLRNHFVVYDNKR